MSSAEFAEWRAFQVLEGGLGPEREDWRVSMIAATILNVNRDPKRSRVVAPIDLIPNWGEDAGRRRSAAAVAEKVKGHFLELMARTKGARRQ